MKCYLSSLDCSECACASFCNDEVKASAAVQWHEQLLNSVLPQLYTQEQFQPLVCESFTLLTECEKRFGYNHELTNRARNNWKKLDEIWCERFTEDYLVVE